MNIIIKNNSLIYLLFLTPFAHILGIAIVELFTFVMTLFFFYKNRSIKYYRDKKFLFFFVFSIYIAINAYFQIPDDDLKISSFFYFRFIILSLSIFFILDYFDNNLTIDKKIISIIFGILILFIFFDSFVQFLMGENLFGFKIINQRISSIFGSELILGAFLVKLLPLFLYLFIYSNTKIKTNFYSLIFFLSLYFSVIYLAAGRTSFVMMFLFIFLILVFVKDLRIVFSLSLLFFISFVFLTIFFDIGKSNPSNRIFIKTFNEMTSHIFYTDHENKQLIDNNSIEKKEIIKNIKIFSEDHNGHYIVAYELFKNNMIFGVGPKGFRSYCRSVNYDPPKGICSTHPHNFIIQILSETGLIGFLFYTYGFIFVFIKILRAYSLKIASNEKNCFLIISIALIVNFFPIIPNGNFFNNWISITSFYYTGVYLYSYKKVFL
jgi:O-antigen ligase